MSSRDEAQSLLPAGEAATDGSVTIYGAASADAADAAEASDAAHAADAEVEAKSGDDAEAALELPAASGGGGPPGVAADFFAAAGVKMPAHLDTKRKRWASLVVVMATSSLASGPMSSWPTLTPLLIDEGVWSGPDQQRKLSEVYSVAIGVAMVAGFFSGLLFDIVGPRVLMMVGAFGVAVCQVMMAVAVQYRSMNFLLWYFYPIATCLGWANSTGVYTWLWLLPEDESLVSAMIGTIQILSDMFVLVAVWLNSQWGLGIQVFFLVIGALSLLAGVLCVVLVPTLEQHRSFAATVRDHKAREAAGAEAADAVLAPKEEADDSCCSSLWKAWQVVRDTAATWLLVHPGACWLVIAYTQAFYMWLILPMVQMYAWYKTMFDEEQVKELVDIWGLVYGLAGAVLLLLFGALVDKVGFVKGLLLLQIPTFVCTVLMCVSDFKLQVVVQVILAGVGNGWQVIIPAFSLHYMPQELFGTFWGLMGAVLGLCEMLLTPLTEAVSSVIVDRWWKAGLPPMGAVGPFRVSICFWFFWTQVFILLYVDHLRRIPLPPAGSTTLERVRRALDDRFASQTPGPSTKPVDA